MKIDKSGLIEFDQIRELIIYYDPKLVIIGLSNTDTIWKIMRIQIFLFNHRST
jgi:hypothetical protein